MGLEQGYDASSAKAKLVDDCEALFKVCADRSVGPASELVSSLQTVGDSLACLSAYSEEDLVYIGFRLGDLVTSTLKLPNHGHFEPIVNCATHIFLALVAEPAHL